MQLTQQRKKDTGAFYTPKVWADMAVNYFKEFIQEDLSEFVFWDMAGGEGALLEALPNDVKKIGTTLELEDVEIMKGKGIEAYPFDFLNDDLKNLPFYNDLDKEKLIIFTNPPYLNLKNNYDCFAKRKYQSNSAENLFLFRICLEIEPKYLGVFNKAGTIQLANELFWKTGIHNCFRSGFTSCSKQGWGLSGNFAILFSLFCLQEYNVGYGSNKMDLGKLYYTYWAENADQESESKTDIENLGQFYKAFHIYI